MLPCPFETPRSTHSPTELMLQKPTQARAGGSQGRMNPLSRRHCCFLPGHLGSRSAGQQPPCPWPGIVPALPEQGHSPQVRKERIHLQNYQPQLVQMHHSLHSVSLMVFPAPGEGEGFLAAASGRGDTGSYPADAALEVSSPCSGGREIAGVVFLKQSG